MKFSFLFAYAALILLALALFSNHIDGTYYYYNPVGKFSKIPDIKRSAIFPASLANDRGKLWNKIILWLKNCLLLGTGANTFMMAYSQDDYRL